MNGFRAALLLVVISTAPAVLATEDFSPAERALFMSKHLASVTPPTTLRYRYSKSGSLEAGFEDRVVVKLSAQANGPCCRANTEFLVGANRLALPDVEAAESNPVILHFLERDIREMSRLTQGKPNYFRKRIRIAVSQGAQVRELSLPYRGRDVPVRHITIAPYLDDPMRSKFERLTSKQYEFTLSDAVPGGVYAIRSRVDAESVGAGPLLFEELVLEGASPLPRDVKGARP